MAASSCTSNSSARCSPRDAARDGPIAAFTGCGGLYAFKDPDAFDDFSLASFPPLAWQTYDVEYRVEKKDGKPVGKPRVTVVHNGIKIHDNAPLQFDAKVGPFHFQDHGDPVQYRNLWVLPVEEK
jgi:hypothetical protein